MPNHPNATAAAITGGLASLLVWALGKWGVTLSLPDAGLIVAAAASIVLYVGKAGVKPALLRLWRGAGVAWNGTGKK